MEEAPVKKEIVVKRLSAFKFAVEVNTKGDENVSGARVSVIQKAPPAAPIHAISSATSVPIVAHGPSETILIRQVIMQRIMEILLWKLLGEERLKCCGYPAASACALLRRVVQLSNIDQKPFVEPAAPCDGSLACFKEQVRKFLQICAPTDEQWIRFGWKSLSEEAILRKIYEEELYPNLRAREIEADKNILSILDNLKWLCHWESQGFTSITKRQAEKPEISSGAMFISSPTMNPRLRLMEDRRIVDSRLKMRYNYPYVSSERPSTFVCRPRPHRLVPIRDGRAVRIGTATAHSFRTVYNPPRRYR